MSRSEWRRSVCRLLVAVAALLVAAGRAAAAENGDIWIGTLNAPRLWRSITLQRLDAAQTPHVEIGDASRRTSVPVLSFTADGDSIGLVVDLAGATLTLAGARRVDRVSGELELRLEGNVLTTGSWSVQPFRPGRQSPATLLERIRRATALTRGALSTGYVVDQSIAPTGLDSSATPGASSAAQESGWQAALAPDGRITVLEQGEPSVGDDGEQLWTARPPFGLLSSDRRMSEKLLLAAVVRSGAWMLPNSPYEFESYESGAAGNGDVALEFRRRGGVVPARVFIERATWLPKHASVEWDTGPYRVAFEDYRVGEAGRFPTRCTTSYKQREDTWMSATAIARHAISRPSSDLGIEYDDTRSPYLSGTLGAATDSLGLAADRQAEDGHLFVRPLIQGVDVGWFHIDTGAPFILLDSAVADSLGLDVLQKAGPRSFRRLDELRIGQLILRGVVAMVLDMSEMSAPAGQKRAGVIGGPVFEHAVVEFDFPGRRLGVFAPLQFDTLDAVRDADWGRLWEEGSPVVEARVGSSTARFGFDTGKSGSVSFTSQAALELGLLNRASMQLAENLTVYGKTFERVVTLPRFELAGREFRNTEVRVKLPGTPNDDVIGIAGIIGRGFFADRVVVFDYARGRIAILGGR